MFPYIDLHCDTLAEGVELNKKDIIHFPERHVDVERLIQGNAMAQFFAAYLDQDKSNDCFADFLAMHKLLMDTLKATDKLKFAKSYADLEANWGDGVVSAFLTIENGCLIDSKMENIYKLKEMGVSLITLTWNQENCFGSPHSDDLEQMQKGLSSFGKEAIEVLNDAGIIIDVAHLSDGGFFDVAGISKKPFIASHSNCRSLCPQSRNLTDEMLKIIGNHGGLAGLNFCPEFLNYDKEKEHSRIEVMCDHVLHIINCAGIEAVAIGTDFDGITGSLEISSPDKMPLLFEALKKRGLSENDIEYFAYKNAKRIIKACI